MPKDGVSLTPSPHLLTTEEVKRLSTHFVTLGVKKIRLTGGEPTTHGGLQEVIAHLSTLRPLGLSTLSMTTNGLLLGSSRTLLPNLWRGGVDGLNISLDTLSPPTFEAISRRPSSQWHTVWAGIQGALEQGWGHTPGRPLKVNCVVQRGVNDHEALSLVTTLTRHLPITLRFIEFMPFAGNGWSGGATVVPSAQLLLSLKASLPHCHPTTPIAVGEAAASAATEGGMLYKGGEDWAGSFGFISTVSSAFCSSCTRLRLTADGNLRVCLHDAADKEVSLRDVLRGGGGEEELNRSIGRAVWGKHAQLGGQGKVGERGEEGEGRAMVKMGG